MVVVKPINEFKESYLYLHTFQKQNAFLHSLSLENSLYNSSDTTIELKESSMQKNGTVETC